MTNARDKDKADKDKPQDDGADGQPVTMGAATGPVDDTGDLTGVDTTHALADAGKLKGD